MQKKKFLTPKQSFELKRKMTLAAIVLLAAAALLNGQANGRELFIVLMILSFLLFILGSVQLSIFCRCPYCGASYHVKGYFPYNCPNCGKPT